MAEKDPKKLQHSRERHDIAQVIAAVRKYTRITEEEKKEIIEDLLLRKKELQTHNPDA